MLQMSLLAEALRSTNVKSAFIEGLTISYKYHFRQHIKEIDSFIKDALNILEELVVEQTTSNNYFRIYNVFKKKYYWFDKAYLNYKLYRKPTADYKLLHNYLINNVIVDYGCGKGDFALKMHNQGIKVIAADITNYLANEVKTAIPFIYTGSKTIQVELKKSTLILLKTVLHHIESKALCKTLNNICNNNKTILIIEDIYDISLNNNDVDSYSDKETYKNYLKLNSREQYLYLVLMDIFGNLIAQGFFNFEYPFQFKTIADWTKLFNKYKYKLIEIKKTYFDRRKLHRLPQVVMLFKPKIN